MRKKVYIDRQELRRMTYKKVKSALLSMGLDTSQDYYAWNDRSRKYSVAYAGEAIEQMGVA